MNRGGLGTPTFFLLAGGGGGPGTLSENQFPTQGAINDGDDDDDSLDALQFDDDMIFRGADFAVNVHRNIEVNVRSADLPEVLRVKLFMRCNLISPGMG